MSDHEDKGPPSGRRGVLLGLTVLTWVGLVLVCLLCFFVTSSLISGATMETCGPHPPVHERMTIAIAGAIACAVFVVPSIVLLVRGRTWSVIVAFVLTGIAFCPPVVAFMLTLFSIGMC